MILRRKFTIGLLTLLISTVCLVQSNVDELSSTNSDSDEVSYKKTDTMDTEILQVKRKSLIRISDTRCILSLFLQYKSFSMKFFTIFSNRNS